MTNMKKKLLAGMLSGALLFTGGLGTYKVFAAEATNATPQVESKHFGGPHSGAHHFGPKHQGHEGQPPREMSEEDITKFSTEIANRYGVSQSEVAQAFKDKKNPRDIKQAAMFAKLSGKSFKTVLDMKTDWREIGDKLGIKPEQVRALHEEEMTEKLAKDGVIDSSTAKSLLKDGYEPFDIIVAGKIAKASNKDIKSVLEKRTINNNWDDVAKEFNVDMKTIMPKGPGHGDRHHMRPDK